MVFSFHPFLPVFPILKWVAISGGEIWNNCPLALIHFLTISKEKCFDMKREGEMGKFFQQLGTKVLPELPLFFVNETLGMFACRGGSRGEAGQGKHCVKVGASLQATLEVASRKRSAPSSTAGVLHSM